MPANPKMETNPISFFILHHSLYVMSKAFIKSEISNPPPQLSRNAHDSRRSPWLPRTSRVTPPWVTSFRASKSKSKSIDRGFTFVGALAEHQEDQGSRR